MVLAGERVLTSDLDPPGATRCRAYSSAGVSGTADNTLTLVPFGAHSYATPSTMHSTSSNTSRIVVPVDGCYQIIAQIGWAANTSNRRVVSVRKNAAGSNSGGTQIMIGSLSASSSSGTQYQITDQLELVAGDYLELFGLQNRGGTLDIVAGETNTFMAVILTAAT